MKHTGILTAVCLLCLLLPAGLGCGKRGDPEPRDQARAFSWSETEATLTGKCLTFTGTLQGAYNNLDSIRLETAPVRGPEDCPGCPFVPREIITFSPAGAGFNRNTGTITLTYCPGPAMAYRWRLIGVSVYNSLPHAVSPVRLTLAE